MNVTLSATGRLKQKVGDAGLVLDLPAGAKVRDALQAASGRLEGEETIILPNEAGEIRSGIVLLVNDEMIPRNAVDRPLNDGDEMTILLPMAGGSR